MQRSLMWLYLACTCCLCKVGACIHSPRQAAAAQGAQVKHHHIPAATCRVLLYDNTGLALGITPLHTQAASGQATQDVGVLSSICMWQL